MTSKTATVVSWTIVAVAVIGLAAWRFVSLPAGMSAARARTDLCAHQLNAAECPFCTPALVERGGQCKEHDVPEALCTRCHPALIPAFKATNDWCAGHDVPESQCVQCNPQLATSRPVTLEGASSVEISQVAAPADDAPRHSRVPRVACETDKMRLRFAAADTARRAGIQVERVERRIVSQSFRCNAHLDYDRNRYSEISSRVPGVLLDVRKDLGESVRAGDVLAVVDCVDLAAAKAEYLQSLALVALWERNHEREHDLMLRGQSSERADLEVETSLAEQRIARARSEQRLRTLGLSEADVAAVRDNNDTSAALSITVPFDGVIVDRHAVVGESVQSTTMLFAVADVSRLWAMLDVPEAEIRAMSAGLPVVLNVDALPGESFGGRVTWVSARVDPKTRALPARAVIDNHDGLLRAEMFGRAVITVRDREEVLTVPKQAVQWDGCCNIAFLAESDDAFRPRKLKLGYETENRYVVLAGLEAGEPVVTQGSYLLKAELMRNSIGAGCCEVEHLDK